MIMSIILMDQGRGNENEALAWNNGRLYDHSSMLKFQPDVP
jgi:hypothetical protein